MKTNKIIIKLAALSIIIFATSHCLAQFFPIGGYQGGLYGSGGDEVFQIFLPAPGGLTAIGGDAEVYLEWDKPLPLGEIKHDDGTAEAWYYLSDPSSNSNLFSVRFVAPLNGELTDIAVLSGADSDAAWEEIMICPDDGTGKPDISSFWETFPSVAVNTSPIEGGEWEILNLSIPQTVANRDTFYIVTRWPVSSTVEPYVGTDTDSNSGSSAWSMDDGATWTSWPENFIMRAYMNNSNSKGVVLKSEEKGTSAYIPVSSIINGDKIHYKSTCIASSVKVPKLSVVGEFDFKSLMSYSIYRSETEGGTYDYLDATTGLSFVDNTASNNTEYYYIVVAEYHEGESEYSNEALAYPQAAANLPFSNDFDIDDGDFYGRDDWQWGIPNYINGPATAHSPPNVWGTVLNGDYSNSSFSWLILPFNLSEEAIYTLEFSNWYKMESGVDYGYLAIDHNNDGSFYVLDSYTGDSGGWTLESLIIHDSLCNSYSKLAFVFSSNDANIDAGFYIDNFNLYRYIDLDLKVFLEGPYNGIGMNTDLNSTLPLSQPYGGLPWNYNGSENVVSMPSTDIVDWMLLELRDATDAVSATPSTTIVQQAVFLLNDGSIVGLDGISNPKLDATINQQLFVVLWHRQHLNIMSDSGLPGTHGHYVYDFSLGESQVYGGNAGYNELAIDIWGMVSGDADANGIVNDMDKTVLWLTSAGLSGYLNTDFNMDGQTDNPDKNEAWINNISKESQVPE